MIFDELNSNTPETIIQSGDYMVPDGWVFSATGKKVYAKGRVRFIGRFIIDDSDDVLFHNIIFRAPLSSMGMWSNSNFDCVTVLNSSYVNFSHCSMIGGTDETVSLKDCYSCGIHNSIVGGCFSVPRKNVKTHSMAILVQCNAFKLTGSVVTGCDRRLPQIEESSLAPSSMLIAGNLLECGRTMSLGLKPIQSFNVDIVNNVFFRSRKTKCPEIHAVNGSTGHALVYQRQNYVVGDATREYADIVESGNLTCTPLAHSHEGYMDWPITGRVSVGPEHRDSWDNALIDKLGSGKTWKSELELPAL
jgi:hypothetical protein